MQYVGADRNPDFDKMQACVLNKISYPNGGYTAFTFEMNEYFNNSVELEWGGLRIKSIKSSDGIDDSKSIVKNFSYVLEEGTVGKSSGTIDDSYSIANRKYFKIIYTLQGRTIPIVGGKVAHFIVRSSEPLNTFDLIAGEQLVYRSVSVSESGSGKTVHLFKSYADHPDIRATKLI